MSEKNCSMHKGFTNEFRCLLKSIKTHTYFCNGKYYQQLSKACLTICQLAEILSSCCNYHLKNSTNTSTAKEECLTLSAESRSSPNDVAVDLAKFASWVAVIGSPMVGRAALELATSLAVGCRANNTGQCVQERR